MDLRDYVRILRTRKFTVLVTLLLCVGAAAGYTMAQTPLYRSDVQLFVSASDANPSLGSVYTGSLFSQERVKSYVDVAQSRPVAQAVIDDLGLDLTATTLQGAISASVPLDTVTLEISVTDPDPATAKVLADAVAAAFITRVGQIERPAGDSDSLVRVSIMEPASTATQPISPRPKVNLALGLFAGLALGMAIAVLRETLDTRLRNPEQAEEILGRVALATVPDDPEAATRPLAVLDRPQSIAAETYRQLRTNLSFVDPDTSLRSLVVTSSIAEEGKSTTSVNLALALATAGQKVILVEGDLRRPQVAELTGLVEGAGLTDVLIGRAELDDVLQPWGPENLISVLTCGTLPPNPAELLGSNQMINLLRELEGRGIVIFDGPPLLPVTDAAILASISGGALLIAAARKVRRDQLQRSLGALQAVDARLLGTVITRVKGQTRYRGYGYQAGGADSTAAKKSGRKQLVRN